MEFHIPSLTEIVYFLLVTILSKYIIGEWIANRLLSLFEFIVVRTERHAVYWVHYHERAMGKSHQYDTPNVCKDGVCRMFNDQLDAH